MNIIRQENQEGNLSIKIRKIAISRKNLEKKNKRIINVFPNVALIEIENNQYTVF